MNGSIRKRGERSWELTIDLGRGTDGKRKRKFVSVKGTKKLAEQKLREVLTTLDKGMPLDISKATVGEFLGMWLKDYAATKAPTTLEGYREKIRNYVLPAIGQIPLAKVTPHQIQSIYASMIERGLSPRTALHVHRVLREALSHAMKWCMLARNVCDAVDPPRAYNKEMVALDTPEVQEFLDIAVSHRYGPVFFLALYTGMRRSEFLGLRWSAVDLTTKTLSVTQTLQCIKSMGLVAMQPKTYRSRRLVSLPPSAVALLSGLKVKQRQEREDLGMEWKDSDYVFSKFDGTPYHPNTVSKAFSKIIKKSGLPKVRLHDLRHTHATIMLKQGADPKTISERLGHSSVVITLARISQIRLIPLNMGPSGMPRSLKTARWGVNRPVFDISFQLPSD